MKNYVSDLHEYFNELDEDLIEKAIKLAEIKQGKININYFKSQLHIGVSKANLLIELLKEKELV